MKLGYRWMLSCFLIIGSSVSAASTYEDGLALYKEGKYSEANQVFSAFVLANPESSQAGDASFYVACSLFALQDFDRFTSATTQFLQQYPNASPSQRVELQFDRASIPYLQNSYAEACRSLDEFCAANPDSSFCAEAGFRAAMCSYQAGNLSDFKQRTESLMNQSPSATNDQKATLHYVLAQIPFTQNKWTEAYAAMKEFESAYPESSWIKDAQYAKARCLFGQESYTDFRLEAEAYLQKYPAAEKDHQALLRFNMAEIPYRQQNWTKAYEEFTQFAAEAGDSYFAGHARSCAAQCLFYMGRYNEFKQQAEALLAQSPPLTDQYAEPLCFYLARLSSIKGNLQETVDKMQQFLARFPGSCFKQTALYERANALLAMARDVQSSNLVQAADLKNQGEAALNECRARIQETLREGKEGPARFELEWMIVESWYVQKNFEELAKAAQQLASEYLKPSREWGMGMLWLGIARANLVPQDTKGAIEAFEAVLSENVTSSTHPEEQIMAGAAYWRAMIALMQGDAVKARAIAIKIRDEIPESPIQQEALKQFGNLLAEAN